ncbi:MAG: hypothetical protein E6Q67_03175 [Roseateles sp.]|nr:MAG: hypothetical protein E6Q67_03175 [Roseateles sp.]
MSKWIDLNDRTTGGKLKVASIDGGTYLFIVGMSNQSPRWQAAVDKLGFVSGGNGKFLIRRAQPGERTNARQFHPVWPNAALVEMRPEDFYLDLSKAKKQRTQASEEERQLSNETAGAIRLGRNLDGDVVYEGSLGRFIWRDRHGATYESPSLRPEMVLRADGDESLDRCADGFVASMVIGEVQHSEDFDRFVRAVNSMPLDGAARPGQAAFDKAHAAVEAAVVRQLARDYETAQDAYGESVRLYEYLPPYAGSRRGAGVMPQPLSIIAQRLLGDTSGQTVTVPNAYDGAAFAFLAPDTTVRAYRGGKDLSAKAVGFRPAKVEWLDAFSPAREMGAQALFFNADPVRGSDGLRVDYRDALNTMRALAENGRAVLVLAGDDPQFPGELSRESRRFVETLASMYSVEAAFETNSVLTQRVGSQNTLRVFAVRNRPPSERWEVAQLPVLHSWDEVKAAVDEALVLAKVKEAEAQSVDIERAAKINLFQSPYIAFSRVSESRTMVPKNLQAPLQAALADVEAVHGPVDSFVEREMGFGENTLGSRLSAEQVDALALLISRMKRGRAGILADETGIGKGRTLGSLATWASKQGRPVVFITDRANLFSDLARDLRDIGEWGRFRPLITNADGRIVDSIGDAGVLAEGTKQERMRGILENNTPLAELDANIVFSTYSQISGEASEKSQWIKNQLADALLIVDEAHIAAGSDSTIARQVAEMTSLAWNVVYSSATWAKSAKNLHIYARAFPETVNVGSLTETMKRGGDGFAEVFSSMLARDGALVRREHDLSRLEFVLEADVGNMARNREVADKVATIMGAISYAAGDLSKLMIRLSQTSIDALKAARGVRSQHQRANIFSSSFAAGSMLYQVQRRMNAALNADNAVRLALADLELDIKPVIVFDDTGESYVRRVMQDQEIISPDGKPTRPDFIRMPNLRDLMRKVLEDVETVKITEVTLDEVDAAESVGINLARQRTGDDEGEAEGIQDGLATAETADGVDVDAAVAQARRAAGDVDTDGNAREGGAAGGDGDEAAGEAPAAAAKSRRRKRVTRVKFSSMPDIPAQDREAFDTGMTELRKLIEDLPELPLSVADHIHNQLRAAGVRTGEISGRTFMLTTAESTVPTEGGIPPAPGEMLYRVSLRPKSKGFVNSTVRAFNSGELDVVLLNRSGATGLSLHASPRFIDKRRRSLIEIQTPENPNERVQLFGRVNRFDQVSFPKIVVGSTCIPGELRQLMMQNKKLAEMSANVRSSRETHTVIKDVVDLLNPLGREVCKQFFIDNPQFATRMGLPMSRIEDGSLDAANAFSQRVSLLRVSEQEHLYELVTGMFDEAVMKAELLGENPLKPKEMDIRAKSLSRRVVMGLDHGGLGSAFDGPVFARQLEYEETLAPLTWSELAQRIAAARKNLVDTGRARQIGTVLDEHRTPIIDVGDLAAKTTLQLDALARTALVATTFASTAEAMASDKPNPVRRGMTRKLWVEQNLRKLVPGARIGLPVNDERMQGIQVPGVIVDLIPPPEKKESQLAMWKVLVVQPGDEHPVAHSVSSLMDGVILVEDSTGQRAISKTVVGHDMLMAERAGSDDILRRAFDQSIRGKKVRHAAMLTGNMYMASEFAAQSKIGHGVIYTDDRGLRQRGILLNRQFSAASLRHMPVRVWTRRAIEELILELAGMNPDQIQVLDGQEFPGACEVSKNVGSGYLMHMSFHGAWSYASNAGTNFDTIVVTPGQGLILLPGKESGKRMAFLIRAAQKRIRERELESLAASGQAPQVRPTEVVADGAAQGAGGGVEQAAAPAAPMSAGPVPRGLRGRRLKPKPPEDPNHVSITQPGAKRGLAPILLKATTPGTMRRAINVLIEGVGLQLFVSPHIQLGERARQVVRDDLVSRIREEIGDDPARLLKLEEQLQRLDSSTQFEELEELADDAEQEQPLLFREDGSIYEPGQVGGAAEQPPLDDVLADVHGADAAAEGGDGAPDGHEVPRLAA